MFNRDTHRTPKQRADRAMLNILARLGGCGFLIYFVVKLFITPKGDTPDTTTATIMAIVLLVLAVVVIGMTILDLRNAIKTGRFKPSTYEDADLAEYLQRKEAESADCACEDEQQELDAHTNDKAEQTAGEKNSENL